MSNSIQELFNVSDQLAKNLEIPHKLAVPKISKIVITAGIGTIKEDNTSNGASWINTPIKKFNGYSIKYFKTRS